MAKALARPQLILLGIVAWILLIIFWTADHDSVLRAGNHPHTRPHQSTPDQAPILPLIAPNCSEALLVENIVVIVKTGATEAWQKLPTQLLTALSCVKELEILSDMEQDLAGRHLYDVLVDVQADIKDSHPDFEIYRKQQRAQLSGISSHVDRTLRTLSPHDAWELDKYKHLHMLEKAWQLRPGRDWYVFIETDTCLVWPNVVQWLARLDPSEKHYIGSPTFLNGDKFGYGGSGLVLSAAAMRAFVDRPGLAREWDPRIKHECCGDYVLYLAARALQVSFHGAWPMFGMETPLLIPYGPAVWCEPVVSMHHMHQAEIDRAWAFDRSRHSTRPLLFKDLYAEYVAHRLPDALDDWDNKCPGDVFDIKNAFHHPGAITIDDCAGACRASPACFQYMYGDPGECKLYSCFTLGKPASVQPGKRFRSRWMKDRIQKWIDDRSYCQETKWVTPSAENARHSGNMVT